MKEILIGGVVLLLTGCGNIVYSSDWQKATAICAYNQSTVFKVDTSIVRTSLVRCSDMKYYVLPER